MDTKKITELIKRAESLRESGTPDISGAEDLALAVMNLVSLEEHFFFTGAKTKKQEYFDILPEIRGLRKELLAKLVPKHEGETWCASKHLLAASMRLFEVGSRLESEKKKEEAKEMFARAYKVFSMFWLLRLGLTNLKSLTSEEISRKPMTMEELVAKLADCCNE
ncbi:MAG: hypothetical protein Q8P52_01345 [bacterium]|nr:hypothetical protein [bacterium]